MSNSIRPCLFAGALLTLASCAPQAAMQGGKKEPPEQTNPAAVAEAPGGLPVPVITERLHEHFPPGEFLKPGWIRGSDPGSDDIAPAKRAVQSAMSLYPEVTLKRHLSEICLVHNLTEDGHPIDGIAFDMSKQMFLACDGSTPASLEMLQFVFHHEFAHLLLKANVDSFPLKTWESLNPAEFRYGHGGMSAILEDHASLQVDETTLDDGFLSEYSKASLTEDFANITAMSLTRPDWIQENGGGFPRVVAKINVVIHFLEAIEPEFRYDPEAAQRARLQGAQLGSHAMPN